MHRLWLIFAQAVTISVAALFVISSLRPDWLAVEPQVDAPTIVELREAATLVTRHPPPPFGVRYDPSTARRGRRRRGCRSSIIRIDHMPVANRRKRPHAADARPSAP